MKVYFNPHTTDGPTREIPVHPDPNDTTVIVPDFQCGGCGLPLAVQGRGRRANPKRHDEWVADAACLNCGAYVGVIHVRLSTIFGVEEDRRVLTSYTVIGR